MNISAIKKSAVFFLCLTLLISSVGCARHGGVDTGTAGPGIEPTQQNADDVTLADSEAAVISSLGNAAYQLGDIEASGDYIVTQAKVISLIDQEGNEWTLSIPKNALMTNETITMRYIGGVEQDVFSGNQMAGVVLEPDGLMFIEPAYLSVKGPSVSGQSCVLSAATDGVNLNFSRSVYNDDQLIATLDHFSSYIAYTPTSQTQIDQLAQVAAADYEQTVREVKTFLKTPVSAPPIPQDIEYSCESGGNRALNMYIARALLPEKEYIKKIMAAGAVSGKLGNNQDAIEYAKQLSARLIKKADKLIKTYQNDNKKLMPVMNFTLNVLRNSELLGIDTHLSSYLETFSDWTERAVKELIDEIKTDHQYTNLCKVIALLHGKAIIEPDYHQTEGMLKEYRQELMDAYSFQLSFEGRVTDVDSDGNKSAWEMSGDIDLSFDMTKPTSNGLFLTGTGTCRYTDYTLNGRSDISLAASDESVKVNVYVTEKKDNLYVLSVDMSTIAPDSLVYTDRDNSTTTIPGMSAVYRYIFTGLYDGAYYNYKMNLHNGRAEYTHNETSSVGSAKGVYDFTLKHTPK